MLLDQPQKLAGISGAICIAFGAFGAHFLKNKIPIEALNIFETGVKYQMYHTLALLFITVITSKSNIYNSIQYATFFFSLGILLFSGSLYFLSIRSLIGMENTNWPGIITPIGGLCFILGWIYLAINTIF